MPRFCGFEACASLREVNSHPQDWRYMRRRGFMPRFWGFEACASLSEVNSRLLAALLGLFSLIFKLTQIFNNTTATLWFTRYAGITSVKNQPMMHVYFKFFWYNLFKFLFYGHNIFTHSKLSTVRNTKYMCIHGYYRPAER